MDVSTDICDLLAAARSGAPSAVGRLFEMARAHLLQLADRELPADLRAKVAPSDMVQETAVDMQRDFASFQGSTPDELFAWLRNILRHNVVDAVRQYQIALKRDVTREVRLPAGTAGPESRRPDGSAVRREDAAAVAAALARLPAGDRDLLELRYWKGLSFVDMAPLLGQSPDTVRKAWYRAVEKVRAELAAENGHEPASDVE